MVPYYDRISPCPYTEQYDHIRRKTEQNRDRIWASCTETVNDRFFLRISPYFSVYDTEINGCNTEPCQSSYFSVYDRLPPCLFDLGTIHTSFHNCYEIFICTLSEEKKGSFVKSILFVSYSYDVVLSRQRFIYIDRFFSFFLNNAYFCAFDDVSTRKIYRSFFCS
jgi:hypothetical protein